MTASSDRLLLVHGGGPQPDASMLESLWREALRRGLQRDHGKRLAAFDDLSISMVYHAREVESGAALEDRKSCLQALSALGKPKDFRRRQYETLPGKSALREFVMDVGAPVAGAVGLGARLEALQVPELASYWAGDTRLIGARDKLVELLSDSLKHGYRTLIVAHCFGSVLAYDALWQLTQLHSPATIQGRTGVDLITLGAPLAADAVRKRLAGADAPPAQRFPRHVGRWANFAAEDDPVCHDKSVADDFRAMADSVGTVIEDRVIYNLAVRAERSAPHHSAGYLVHPAVAQEVAGWLRGG